MKRRPDSHKGENGRVAVIGGSTHMHGAPLLAALAAENSGVDLVYVCLPQCHAEVAKNTSLNFQVHPFVSDELSAADVEPILELLATMDVAVIGPGIAHNDESLGSITDIIAAASCQLVIDATALQPNTIELTSGKSVVLTPHLGELERMELPESSLASFAVNNRTIVLKGMIDAIYSNGKVQHVRGGNAGLTVGGTGDALAGLIGGLIAQDLAHDEACSLACTIIKRAATGLAQKRGYSFTAKNVIDQIPVLYHAQDVITHD